MIKLVEFNYVMQMNFGVLLHQKIDNLLQFIHKTVNVLFFHTENREFVDRFVFSENNLVILLGIASILTVARNFFLYF